MEMEERPNEAGRRGYASLTNDYMFKRIFGSEECKDILIAFLNRIVGNGEIEDVDFLNTEHLGQTAEDRKAVFDICVRTNCSSSFLNWPGSTRPRANWRTIMTNGCTFSRTWQI